MPRTCFRQIQATPVQTLKAKTFALHAAPSKFVISHEKHWASKIYRQSLQTNCRKAEK